MYVRLHKDTVADWRLDSRAHPCIHIGSGEVVGHKSVMGYTIDFSNNGHIGGVVHSTQFWVDPTLFPYSKAGEGRVTTLSFGKYFLGKEEFEQEVPTPPEYEKWIIDARADDGSVSDDDCAEEQIAAQKVSDTIDPQDKEEAKEREQPEQSDSSEIAAFDTSTGQYTLRTAGSTSYVDVSEMFEMLKTTR